MTKIIDLSKPIQYNKEDPWFMRVKIKHKPHRKAKWLIRALGLPFRLFPKDFTGWADDLIQKLGVHSTTHIDAPWHFSPTTNGARSKTIDEIPLEWCYGEGLVIDMRHKEDFDPITIEDIKEFLSAENLEIKENMIVLIMTGRDKYNGTKDFHKKGTGMGKSATEWLIDQGVKVMGIDSWGWDLPLPYMIQKAKESNDPDLFWEAHLVGKEYCHMEQLVNLEQLPYSGFKVAAFPLKLVGASAGPSRVVGILNED
ncbi:cyclase family protein [Echinicola jeungdonensis]|uniref:Cyclase family protein n=1 Tax=Echinicola jeungdonensis TaxID=709343 RepID=A0ABV5J8B0_9BACT|nr:cyclase family protein [Echinicola jeungdonensis]MDN3670969.1 cyclase family protein [Echinicola jeungdonensis]